MAILLLDVQKIHYFKYGYIGAEPKVFLFHYFFQEQALIISLGLRYHTPNEFCFTKKYKLQCHVPK